MATGQSIIEDALLDIGVGSPNQSVPQSVLNHGLRSLNRMWSSWSAELGPVYATTTDTHSWPSGSISQTIGSGGDINTVRPIEITSIQTQKDSLDYTLNRVSYEQFQTTVLKTISTDYPDVFAYLKGYPLGTIYMFPVPASTLTVTINSKKALTAFTMAGTIALPDGYEEAILKNLAIELAPAHGKSVRQETVLRAKQSKDAIVEINTSTEMMEMWPDSMIPGMDTTENIDLLTND